MIRFLAVLLIAAMPAWADGNSGLKRLTLRTDVLGWEAVGKVVIGEQGAFCSGALIANDLVLTAAHCVYDRQGNPRKVDTLTFKAGLRDGNAIAESAIARAVAHPGYTPGSWNWNSVRHDVALLELATSIPSGVASPFRTDGAVQAGRKVSVVSFAAGREEALSRQRTCGVLGRYRDLMAFDCDVYFGSSGAPVFYQDHGPPRIVSIVSAGSRTPEGTVSFGMELPALVAELKHAFRTGKGVWPDPTSGHSPLRENAEHRSAGHFVRP